MIASILVRRRQIGAQVAGDRVRLRSLNLRRIGAHVFLRHQPDFEEALAELVRRGPRVGVGVVAACAMSGEERFTLTRPSADRSCPSTSSGHFGGARRSSRCSILLRLSEHGTRLERDRSSASWSESPSAGTRPMFRRGCARSGPALVPGPLRPRALRRVPNERRLDRRHRRRPILGNTGSRSQHSIGNEVEGVNTSRAPHDGSRHRLGAVVAYERRFAFEPFSKCTLGVGARSVHARGQTVELWRIGQSGLQGVIERKHVRHEVERVVETAVDSNLLSLVGQLRVVTGGAVQADGLALPATFGERRSWSGRSANRPDCVRGFGACGMSPYLSLFASERKRSWPPATSRLKENVVGNDLRALRDLVVRLAIGRRPRLIQIDDRVAAGCLRGDLGNRNRKCGCRRDK